MFKKYSASPFFGAMLTVMKGIVRTYILLFSPILLLVLAGGYLLAMH